MIGFINVNVNVNDFSEYSKLLLFKIFKEFLNHQDVF